MRSTVCVLRGTAQNSFDKAPSACLDLKCFCFEALWSQNFKSRAGLCFPDKSLEKPWERLGAYVIISSWGSGWDIWMGFWPSRIHWVSLRGSSLCCVWGLGRCWEHPSTLEQCQGSAAFLTWDKILGGDTGRTAEPNWPKGSSQRICAQQWEPREGECVCSLLHLSSGVIAMATAALLPRSWLDIACCWAGEDKSFVLLY